MLADAVQADAEVATGCKSSPSAASARVGEILSALGRGERLGAEVGVDPEVVRAIRRHCFAQRSRYSNEIARTLAARRTRIARKKFNGMLRNTSVRLAALMEANAKHTRAKRAHAQREGRDALTINPLPFGELCALLPEVDIFGRVASGRLALIPKDDGERRPVISFGLADRACGILLKHALTPFARVHPQLACHKGQFMLAGGSHAACRTLTEALEQAPPEAVFVQVDVKRFYEHISIEHLSQFTGLSRTIIRGFISAGDLVRRDAYRQWQENRSLFIQPIEVTFATIGSSDAGSVLQPVDRCIAPGSAVSPVVGEMVMGHVLREVCARLGGALYLGSYSDNVGILTSNTAAASAFVVALRDVLKAHPAGPFRVGKSSMQLVTRGFSFLGYRFRLAGRGVTACPRRAALDRFFYHHTFRLMEASVGNFVAQLPELRAEVRQFANSFRLWKGRGRWVERQEARLFQFLIVHCREHGISLCDAVGRSDWMRVAAAERRLDAPSPPSA